MEFPVTPEFRESFTPWQITSRFTSDIAVRIGSDLAVLHIEPFDGGDW